MQQLEQEVKLDPNPGWSLPDLSGILPGVEVHALADVALETTYYDTADLRLARHHLTLRFRRQTELVTGPRAWTTGRQQRCGRSSSRRHRTARYWRGPRSRGRARERRRRPGDDPPGAPGPRGAACRPVATSSKRYIPKRPISSRPPPSAARWNRSPTFRVFAGGPSCGHRTAALWPRSMRIQLPGETSWPARNVLSGTATLLTSVSGRSRSSWRRAALWRSWPWWPSGSRRREPAVAPARANWPGSWPVVLPRSTWPISAVRHRNMRAQEIAMSGVLREQARSCLDTLIDHDPAIRLDDPDPEHIHRSRVATRRLRTILREFAPLVTYGPEDQVAYSPDHPAANDAGDVANAAEAWFDTLTRELKWLGGILGSVRDSDVRLQSLEQHCAKLPAADAAAGETLLKAARDERRGRHEGFPRRHQHGPLPGRPAGARRSRLRAAALGHLCPTNCGSCFPSPRPPACPHWPTGNGGRSAKLSAGWPPSPQTRPSTASGSKPNDCVIWLKWPHPLSAPPPTANAAVSTAKAATALQDVLGDLHDAVVTEAWLRQTASLSTGPVHTAGLIATGLASGELIAVERETQRKSRAAWLGAWRRRDRRGLRAWATDSQ